MSEFHLWILTILQKANKDLSFLKKTWSLNEKLHAFSGNHFRQILFRLCYISYTSREILKKHQGKCGQQIKTAYNISKKPFFWIKFFHKNPKHFGVNGDFECKKKISDGQTATEADVF